MRGKCIYDQFQLDEDYNVPDAKEDVGNVIEGTVCAKTKTVLENESSPYHNRLTEVASIEAVTKRMVRITLVSPNVNFPKLLDIPIYRAGTTDEGEFAEGTGPYKPVQDAPHGRWRPTRTGTAAFSAPFGTLRWSK